MAGTFPFYGALQGEGAGHNACAFSRNATGVAVGAAPDRAVKTRGDARFTSLPGTEIAPGTFLSDCPSMEPGPPRIFISYSRRDGRPNAERLQTLLRAHTLTSGATSNP